MRKGKRCTKSQQKGLETLRSWKQTFGEVAAHYLSQPPFSGGKLGLTDKAMSEQPLDEKAKAEEAYVQVSRGIMKDIILDKLEMTVGRKMRIDATPTASGLEESMEVDAASSAADIRKDKKKKARKAKSEAKKVAKEVSKRSDEMDMAAGRTEVSGKNEGTDASSSSSSDAK